MSIASARHIASGGGQRNPFLSGENARRNFAFYIADRIPLQFGKAGDLLARELNVGFERFRHLLSRLCNVIFGHEDVAVVAVQFAAELARGIFAAFFNGGEHFSNNSARIFVRFRRRFCGAF